MKKIEQLILEHGNIETLCCYVEEHYEQLSDEMKNILSSFRDRLTDKLGTNVDHHESLYDLPLADFFHSYRSDNYYNAASAETRAINVLKKHGYETLRDVLKVPRSELQKINGFGECTFAFHYYKNAMECAGLDPYMILK